MIGDKQFEILQEISVLQFFLGELVISLFFQFSHEN